MPTLEAKQLAQIIIVSPNIALILLILSLIGYDIRTATLSLILISIKFFVV